MPAAGSIRQRVIILLTSIYTHVGTEYPRRFFSFLDAQLYFRHMPEDMRKENQRIFKKEFVFADKISKLLLKSQISDDALMEQLQQCLEEYTSK